MDEQKFSEEVRSRLKGFTGYCGIEFNEVGAEKCVISCRLRPELLNPTGIAHGGLIATLTDVAAGMMALQADGWCHHVVTQSCNIHFLSPGIGSGLSSESRVIRKGKRVCVVQVDCFTDVGKLCTTATYEVAYLSER